MISWYTIRNRKDLFEKHYFPHKEAQEFLGLTMEEYASGLANLGYAPPSRRAHLVLWCNLCDSLEESEFTPLPPLRYVGDKFATYRFLLANLRAQRWPKPFTTHINDILSLLSVMKVAHVVDLYAGVLAHTFYLRERGFSRLGQTVLLDAFGLVPQFGEYVLNYSSEDYLPAEELSRKLHLFMTTHQICRADLLAGILRIKGGVERSATLAVQNPGLFYDPEFRARKATGLQSYDEDV